MTIENKYNQRFKTNLKEFRANKEYYIELNHGFSDRELAMQKINKYLEELKIPCNNNFVLKDCKDENRQLVEYDFCLYYRQPDLRCMIDLEPRNEIGKTLDIFKRKYCEDKGFKRIVISYTDILDSEKYKETINDFLKQ